MACRRTVSLLPFARTLAFKETGVRSAPFWHTDCACSPVHGSAEALKEQRPAPLCAGRWRNYRACRPDMVSLRPTNRCSVLVEVLSRSSERTSGVEATFGHQAPPSGPSLCLAEAAA